MSRERTLNAVASDLDYRKHKRFQHSTPAPQRRTADPLDTLVEWVMSGCPDSKGETDPPRCRHANVVRRHLLMDPQQTFYKRRYNRVARRLARLELSRA